MGAEEGRRAPEAEDLPHGLGNRDLGSLGDLLENELHREERREVFRADGLPRSRVQNRLRPVRHVGRDVVPALGERGLR